VADIVALGIGRDHQERDPGAWAATTVNRQAFQTVGSSAGTANTVTIELVSAGIGGAGGSNVCVIVPAVGVIPGYDNSRVFPAGLLLQEVHHFHHESLLVQRIGVTGVAVLERRCFQVGNRGVVTGFNSRVEVVDIIFVIGGIDAAIRIQRVAHGFDRIRTGMGRVAGGLVVLEPGVVGNVIRDDRADGVGVRATTATAGAVGIGLGQVEAAHEATPGNAAGIQQVADVFTGHPHGFALAGANVGSGINVVDHGVAALAVVRVVRGFGTVLN